MNFPCVCDFILDDDCDLNRDTIAMIKTKYGTGSTYLPLDQVFKVQRELKTEPVRTILVRRENGPDVEVTYVPVWPRFRIQVVDYGSDSSRPFFYMKAVNEALGGGRWNNAIVFFVIA